MLLQGNRILVTGAGGFIGGYVARRLASEKVAEVRALVRSRSQGTDLSARGISVTTGNLLDPSSLYGACAGAETIIHAAACTRVQRSATVWATTVEGTRNLLEAAARAGVQRFVFISSFAVYLSSDSHHETSPLAESGDLYADSKIAAETMVRDFSSAVILRPPAVYGPGSAVWSERYRRLAARNRLFVPGGGHFSFAYVFIENLVDAIVSAANPATPAGTYNILDGHMPYRDFVAPYAEQTGARLRYLPLRTLRALASASRAASRVTGLWFALSPQYAEYLVSGRCSTATAERANAMGWAPRYDFHQGIELTLSGGKCPSKSAPVL